MNVSASSESADLEKILAGDILICERVQTGGALFNMQHPLLKCLLRQKKKLSTPEVKELPMGVILEIGRALDVETRRNLMMANKLMMNAFTKEDRQETSAEYASYMLANTWKTLFETSAKKQYNMLFRFEQRRQRTYVELEIGPAKIKISVSSNHIATLQDALPQAQMQRDIYTRNKWYVDLSITYDSIYENNEGKDNIATPSTVIDVISRITYGMEMLPPSAYK